MVKLRGKDVTEYELTDRFETMSPDELEEELDILQTEYQCKRFYNKLLEVYGKRVEASIRAMDDDLGDFISFSLIHKLLVIMRSNGYIEYDEDSKVYNLLL